MNKYLSKLVKYTLVSNLDARDDLMLLVKIIHDKEMQHWSYSKTQYYDAFFSGNLSNVHTIGRLWRLVQEKFPELRGKEWEERQRQAGLISKQVVEKKFTQQLEIF